MEFFISKNTTLPILKMQIVNNGKYSINYLTRLLETASISFSMKKEKTGILKISNKPAYITEKTFIDPNTPTEYYVYYKFDESDTNKSGRFLGQFIIKTDDGTLISPIREELYINITE